MHWVTYLFLVLTGISPMYGNLWNVVFSLVEFSVGVSFSDSLFSKIILFVYQSNREVTCFSQINADCLMFTDLS